MASFTFNVAKGRVVELHNRVDGNDPATSGLVLVVLAEAGLETDDQLRDYDTLAAILAGASSEVGNTGYARKVLTDTELAPATVDDAADKVTVTFSSQTYSAVAAGDSWRKAILCYAPDTAGLDSTFIPMCAHDLLINGAAIIPGGADIVIAAPNGYAVAT